MQRCTLDFLARTFDGSFEARSDGNLKAEYDAMTIIRRQVVATGSNDAFSCMLPGEANGGADYDDLYSYLQPGATFLHCLDIGSHSSLSGLVLDTVANISLQAPYNGSTLFGGAECEPTRQSEWTNLSRVGDGLIGAYDVAVLLWSQFKRPPYDELPRDSFSSVETVAARIETADICCANRGLSGYACVNKTAYTRQEYRLLLADDACAHVVDYSPGLAEPTVAAPGRRAAERELSAREPAAAAHIGLYEWARVPGVGTWTKIVLPVVPLALEISLLNVEQDSTHADLAAKAPPPEGLCEADTAEARAACMPDASIADGIVIGFHRRVDEVEATGITLDDCATVRSADDTVMANGLLSLYQEPPASACPFDVYIWVPDGAPSYDENAACGGAIGVDFGSTINDGRGGFVQRATMCAGEHAPPPPLTEGAGDIAADAVEPTMPPPPPSADSPISVVFELVVDVERLDERNIATFRFRLARILDVPPENVAVEVVDANGEQAQVRRRLQTTQLRLVASTKVASMSDAVALAAVIENLSVEDASVLVGKPVISIGSPQVSTAKVPSPPSPAAARASAPGGETPLAIEAAAKLDLSVPMAIALLVLFALVTTIVACACRRRRRLRSQTVIPDPIAGMYGTDFTCHVGAAAGPPMPPPRTRRARAKLLRYDSNVNEF